MHADPANPRTSYSSDYTVWELAKRELEISIGYSRPAGRISEVVLGGLYLNETQHVRTRDYQIEDNDPDGNGIGFGGFPPEVEYEDDQLTTDRDYSGFGASLRLRLRWSEKLRSEHSLGWSRSTGDGETLMGMRSGDSAFWRAESVGYAYRDGTLDDGFVQSSLGFHETFFEGRLLTAIGVEGWYTRTAFDEGADGDFQASNSTGWEFELPYSQSHDNVDEVLNIAFPMGIEWTCHRYLRVRIGTAFYAFRDESDRKLTTNAFGVLSDPTSGEYGDTELRDYDANAGVDARFNTGLEFNANNRFVLELATYGAQAALLADYYELSARFHF
jgi:hypothetical protein